MRTRLKHSLSRGFTLVEVIVASTAAMVLVAALYSLAHGSNLLAIKSLSINSTGTDARNAFDRIQYLVQLAYNVPTLIDSNGAALTGTAATAGGPAAGLRFDRYMGAPYILTVPSAGLSGAAGSTMTFTMDKTSQVPPPAPAVNDAFLISTTVISGTLNQLRAVVKAPISVNTNGNRVSYTVTLASSLANSISYDGNNTSSALLVRPTAIVVKTNAAGNNELRFINSYVTKSGGAVDVDTNYVVLTDQIDTQDADKKPFTFGTDSFVRFSLRVRARNYDKYLVNKQADSFATFMRLDSAIALKCNPGN